MNHDASGQWVVAGSSAVGGGDLAPPGDAELLPQNVRMSLGSSGRDAQPFADLLVRTPRRDQLDDLPLAGRDHRNRALQGLVHDGLDATSACRAALLTERGIFAPLHAASSLGTTHEAGLVTA